MACIAAVIALVSLVLVVTWRMTPVQDPVSIVASPLPVAPPLPVRDLAVAQSKPAAGTANTTTRAKASVAAAPAERTEVEVCGFGTVVLRPDDPYPFQGIPVALREAALDTAEALMLASDDIQVRAAALWIGMQRGKRDAHGRVEKMARLAVGSQDPVVYALAVQACKGWAADDYGACSLISRAQWAQLDPDNAVPWLELAAEARQNNEPDVEEQAMRMATHARHINTREGMLPTLVDRALGSNVTPLQRTLALSESWSAQAAWTVSHATHLNVNGSTRKDVPEVDLDLSCDSVNRMQDWMRQHNAGDDAALMVGPSRAG